MHSGSNLAPELHGAQRVALFGGSFDPPHGGHLAMALGALQARALDHVIWVPAARPPHKPGRVLAAGAARMRMLECLLGDQPKHSIWSVELERAGQSYSVDTLRTLRSALPATCQLFLILGSDNLPGFPSWHEMPAILQLAEPIVLPRSGSDANVEQLEGLTSKQRQILQAGLLELDPIDVSSTEIRSALLQGSACPQGLPQPLWEYLLERGIYSR